LPGSDVNGIAVAGVGEAEGTLALRINPAGLVQASKGMSFCYEVSSSLIIQDIFAGNWRVVFDTFPFLGWQFFIGEFPVGISFESLFNHSHASHPLQVRALRFSTAFAILPNFSLGLGVAPIFGFEGSGWALGWNVRAGMLWKVAPTVQIGASLNTPFNLNWNNPVNAASLQESYPLLADLGMVWQIYEKLRLYAALDFVGVNGISYVLNGAGESPRLDGDWSNFLHPKLGVRFQDPIFGSLISLGVLTGSEYYDDGGQTQWLLSAGIRARASWATITASLVDSYLLKWIATDNTGEERINIGLSFSLK